jgi:DNA-binding transcriptional LysR family regulator
MGRFQLNLNHAISFYYLAREMSFSRAADKLGMTQPAVTQHIRGLEAQFGLKLVNIKKKRVQLTKAGERFMAYAEELVNQAVVAENFLKSYQFNNISLGIASPLMFYLTGLIDHFKEKHPSIKVTIKEASSQPLVDELMDYKLDICMVGVLAPYKKRLRAYRIHSDERLVFVASPNCALTNGTPIAWSELISHPLIIQAEGSASRAIILHQFKKRGLTPNIGAEVNNIYLAKELARQKKGLAFMFEPNIRQEVDRGELKVIPMEDGPIKMGAIDILVHREERLSPSVESFLMVVKEYFNNSLNEINRE